MNYKSPYMMRKNQRSVTSRRSAKRSTRKSPKPAKRAKSGSAPPSPLDGLRPPQPGQGKRGEQGYFAYLLRRAAGPSRLTLDRALSGLGAPPPQFLVLTMLKA